MRLEETFWRALLHIALQRDEEVDRLLEEAVEARSQTTATSAIRSWILNYYFGIVMRS